MASKYRDRYGISGLEVENLIRRFYRRLYDSEWDRADDFVKWCSENGYESGLRLCRKDTSKPHGPENSYFKKPEKTVRVIAKDKRRRKEERKSLVSPFCEGCTEACRKGVGCERWQQYYVTNWDKNIRVAKPAEINPEPAKPMVFRYEHPDLVREGIVFDPSRRYYQDQRLRCSCGRCDHRWKSLSGFICGG